MKYIFREDSDPTHTKHNLIDKVKAAEELTHVQNNNKNKIKEWASRPVEPSQLAFAARAKQRRGLTAMLENFSVI